MTHMANLLRLQVELSHQIQRAITEGKESILWIPLLRIQEYLQELECEISKLTMENHFLEAMTEKTPDILDMLKCMGRISVGHFEDAFKELRFDAPKGRDVMLSYNYRDEIMAESEAFLLIIETYGIPNLDRLATVIAEDDEDLKS